MIDDLIYKNSKSNRFVSYQIIIENVVNCLFKSFKFVELFPRLK